MNLSSAQTLATHAAATPTAPWSDIWSHRGYLVRFAQRRLRDPMLAEDVVHDVFEAVLCGRATFAGRSALRSWLTAILKHKIVDMVRQRVLVEGVCLTDHEMEMADAPSPQPQPDEVAEQRELLRQTLARIDALPPSLREAITLRVVQDQPTEVVCAKLSITENNLFQRLFRARLQLATPALCH